MAAYYKRTGFVILFGVVIVTISYWGFCFWVASDRSASEPQEMNIAFLSTGSSSAPVHSGAYYKKKAERLQYAPHDPDDVEKLYKRAILQSPADYLSIVSYIEYLLAKRCCHERIGQLVPAALLRNPKSTALQYAGIAVLFETGNKTAAFSHLRYVEGMEPQTKLRLLRRLLDQGASGVEMKRSLPPTIDNLMILSRILASKGRRNRMEWMAIYSEIAERDLPAVQSIELAKQAMELQEYDIARERALLAANHPQTEARAQDLLKKLEKRRRK